MFSIVDVQIFPGEYTFDSGSVNENCVSLKAVLFDAKVQVSSVVLLFGMTILGVLSLLLGTLFTKVYFSHILPE